MIAMQMGNENFIQLARVKRGVQQLMLRTFTTVEKPQPGARRVLKIEQNGGDVARPRRTPAEVPKKISSTCFA